MNQRSELSYPNSIDARTFRKFFTILEAVFLPAFILKWQQHRTKGILYEQGIIRWRATGNIKPYWSTLETCDRGKKI